MDNLLNLLELFLLSTIVAVKAETFYHGQRLDRIPYFTSTSKNDTYREGSAVKLTCKANAKPAPSVRWLFKDREMTASKKHKFMENATILIIYPFTKNDTGSYKCVAKNKNGERQHIIDVALIENSVPFIVDAPESRNAKPGEQITFFCKAVGVPPPKIFWSLNGIELSSEDPHITLLNNNTELVIKHVTREDHGKYVCRARNPIGEVSAEVELVVNIPRQHDIDETLTDELLNGIVNKAKEQVDRAIVESKKSFDVNSSSPWEYLRLFKFSVPQNVELTKAREIYEQSLLLIQDHLREGLKFSVNDLPTNFSFESMLAVSHIQTIMELSGCVTGPFRNPCTYMCFYSNYRSYDGQCNNIEHPFWGVAQTPFRRNLPPVYENGFNTPVGWDPEKTYYGFKKPNPRSVSIKLVATEHITPHFGYTAMMKQWGQFIAHDIEQTAPGLARQTYMKGAICNRTCENLDPCYNVPMPPEDPRMQMEKKPEIQCIEVERSSATCGSGQTGPIYRQLTYREQMNILTAFIDASNVYGNSEVDALDLRDLFGDHGLLRFDIVSPAQQPYLPFERESAMECRRNRSRENPISCFLAGDYRANEQLALLSMHTLWLREHNRIAANFLEINPHWDGETIYQETRKLIGAIFQVITYEHWLPKVLGSDGYEQLIGKYTGYDPEVNPTLANSFSAAGLRFGHTIVNPVIYRLGKDFKPIKEGNIPLHESFFAPERILSEGGIDPLLRGLFGVPMKHPKEDQLVNKELTHKLFSRVEDSMYDLVTINIQRGRDHGLPSYIEFRRWCNFSVPETWEDLAIDIPNAEVRKKLEELYGHPGNVDLWVGAVTEKRLAGALVGPTIGCIISDQFRRLRAGDRFWYENDGVFTKLQLQQIRKASLSAVLCNNGDDIDRVQKDVFEYIGDRPLTYYKDCSRIPQINLNVWQSCCEKTCISSVNAEVSAKRKKRDVDEAKRNGTCELNGVIKADGEEWKLPGCISCICKQNYFVCDASNECQAS